MSTRIASTGNVIFARTFAAFRHRNYRLYFGGQTLSLIGTWMQIVASGWLVLRITDSAFLLGVVTAMESLPSLFLSLFAGALADTLDRRRIAMWTQSLAGMQALALGILVITHHATFWNVFWLALFAGLVNAIDLPVRQSLVYDLVGRRDILNAIALNSMLFNVARIIGPAIAAIIIARAGEAVNFFANATSYIFVVFALGAMRLNDGAGKPQRRENVYDQMAQGVRYVVHHPLLARLFAGIVVFSIFGFNYILLMPVFARFTLHGGANTLGLLLTCLGIGALGGSFTMAGRRKGSMRTLVIMAFVFPISLIAFAYSPTLLVAIFTVMGLGYAMILFVVRFSTFLQIEVPDAMRGRAMGLYNTCMMGLAPIGALQAGAFAQALGAGRALAIGAAVCVVATLALLFFPRRTVSQSIVRTSAGSGAAR
ncbi:MAG: MFS transporter [Candidatus Eremiobacteraeota bacterium]|nr:MFS transporter [Candidatus Eremiobacteraeota bacterium]MBC5826733.1 MFS transporter [Candidatus Eremiobacteraeota bacterium]